MPWTDDQEKALDVLMNVECKINAEGCDGPWCSARALIAEAFDLEVKGLEPEPEEGSDAEAQG